VLHLQAGTQIGIVFFGAIQIRLQCGNFGFGVPRKMPVAVLVFLRIGDHISTQDIESKA
jgi:hypothetical protein